MKNRLFLIALLLTSVIAKAQQNAPAGAVIVPVTSFLGGLLKGDIIADAPREPGILTTPPWF
jgi:hypothetical protein